MRAVLTDDALRDPVRIAALGASRLLDTPPEAPFDRFTGLAARLMGAPAAVLSLVDAERQFFKSSVGLPEPWASARATPLSHSFCQHVAASGAALVVSDARTHPLVRDNPAIDALGIVAYLGVPLATPEGLTLGALAVVDSDPREWADADVATLSDLAAAVMTEVGLRAEVRERRVAEAALRESEERYRLALAAGRDLVYDYDLASGAAHRVGAGDAIFIYDSSAAAPSLASWRAALHPADAPRVDAGLRTALASPAASRWSCEYRIRRPDGACATVADRATIVRDADGRARRLVGAITDLTGQRRTEDALRESEARFRQLVEAAHEGVWAVDGVGRTTYVNPRMAEMLGYPAEALLAREFFDFLDAPSAFDARTMFARRRRGIAETNEFTFVRADGGLMWATVSASPLNGTGGEFTGALALVSDVTEQRRAEAALRESEARFRLALDAARMVVWERDLATDRLSDGMIPSGGGDALMDYADFMRTVHPDDRAEVERVNDDAVARGGGFVVEFRVVGADGAVRWTQTVGRVVAAPDGRPARMVGVSLDVTDQRTLEAQLRQAQKMEAVGRLAGGIAHDFNNLLTVITANTDFALEALPAGSQTHADLGEIAAAARRAADLTTQLLAFSRQQVLAPHHVDLNVVVAEVERMLLRVIGADVAMATELCAEAAPVYADEGQLGQVLMNLVVNARDAMPDGGTLTIQTAPFVVDAARAAARPGLAPGAYVALRVRDTGMGMDAATRTQVFEPFFTTKEVGRGTGLGLATVYGIVKQSGGYVWVESEPGVGSTFTVLLPRAAPAGGAAAAAAETPGPGRRAETVLLVEDEAPVRAAVRRMLERAGHRVLEAEHGGAALALAARHPGEIDLVITDVVMPETGAGALLAELRERHPELPVLLMSGYSPDAVPARGTMLQGASLLAKPFTAAELGRRVRELLDRV
jgi:PAS domain S-box-containing protein